MAAISTILLVAVSCNKEIADTTDPKLEKHTCEMKLIGSLVNYDGPETRADANTTTWADGSVIYLRMNSPLGSTTGEAVYNANKDVWTISYYGSLYEGVSNSCTALYLEDKVSYENSLFTMDEGTAIYEDLEGSYIYDGGDLVVTANLKPKTGRIRFSGETGSIIKIYGVTHYTTYDIGTNIYTTSAEPFKLTVGSDGYTPYFYGYFTDIEEPNVKVWIDAKEAYTRFCSKNIFNQGQSGIMTLPTANSHNGWADGLHFNANGAPFKMIAVEGGTFMMGDPESSSEYYTAHNVTLTGYCIGETEVTAFLYERLNDPTCIITKPNQPSTKYYWSKHEGEKIVDMLNKIIPSYFDLPTEAQWEFAARGGMKSNGYIYSGSDILEEVGWCSTNSSSTVHDVKQKKPNELGIYDMSGNVAEFVKDYYGPFTSASVIDPYISKYSGSGSTRYCIRGGSYGSFNNCESTYRNYVTESTTSGGYRLALNWN